MLKQGVKAIKAEFTLTHALSQLFFKIESPTLLIEPPKKLLHPDVYFFKCFGAGDYEDFRLGLLAGDLLCSFFSW